MMLFFEAKPLSFVDTPVLLSVQMLLLCCKCQATK